MSLFVTVTVQGIVTSIPVRRIDMLMERAACEPFDTFFERELRRSVWIQFDAFEREGVRYSALPKGYPFPYVAMRDDKPVPPEDFAPIWKAHMLDTRDAQAEKYLARAVAQRTVIMMGNESVVVPETRAQILAQIEGDTMPNVGRHPYEGLRATTVDTRDSMGMREIGRAGGVEGIVSGTASDLYLLRADGSHYPVKLYELIVHDVAEAQRRLGCAP